MRTLLRLFLLLVAIAAAALWSASQIRVMRPTLAARTGPALSDVAAWGYQLQRLRPDLVPAEIDLLVTDYSRDGTPSGAWTADEVARMTRRAGLKPRIVLAYMSIGEAENYRYYWQRHWTVAPPRWLGPENEDWKGNYAVRYWLSGWQRVILNPDATALTRIAERFLPSWKPYIDHVIEAGFDGVYLDKIDGFEDWEKSRPAAKADMMIFVAAIARYAKSRRPGFLIVPQNGEALLELPAYIEHIDAIAKEDLRYGIEGDGKSNSVDEIEAAIGALERAKAAGKPVLVVEYIVDPAQQQDARSEAARLGYRLLFARRELNLPPEVIRPEGALADPGK